MNTEKKSRYKQSRKERVLSWIYLSPSLLGVLVFFILPFFVVIYYSLVNNPVQRKFVGLENYLRVLKNTAFQQATSNTLLFSAIAVPLAVILSLLLAVVLESKIPFKSRFRTYFLSPLMVPIASVVLIWQVLFHYNGLVNIFALRFGFDKTDWLKSSYAPVVIVILFLWKNLGYNMILFMSALSSVPQDLIEVASLEGANPLQVFFHIKMRYLASTILFVTIMSLINSFKVFREIYLMTGAYPYDSLYMMQHFMNNTFQSLDYQKLSAAAVLLCIVMIAIIGVLFVSEDRFTKDIEEL